MLSILSLKHDDTVASFLERVVRVQRIVRFLRRRGVVLQIDRTHGDGTGCVLAQLTHRE